MLEVYFGLFDLLDSKLHASHEKTTPTYGKAITGP